MRTPILTFRVLALGLLLAAVSCSDDNPTVLEDACHVVVEDCGVGTSVGACLDALGSQFDECLLCIAESGCDYATRCETETTGCELPGAYAR